MAADITDHRHYRYWDAATRSLDMVGMLADLEVAPANSVIVLHVCNHNPTALDPSPEQWQRIADVMERRQLFPFFDSAYQGMVTGDPDVDVWAVRYFVERGFELVCAQSFSKNFGLYGERVGHLVVVQKDAATTAAVMSQLDLLIRGRYANPPAYGSQIVETILNDRELRAEWLDSLWVMMSHISEMRAELFGQLVGLRTPGSWTHIFEQIGMFVYTGLSEAQVQYCMEEYHVYLNADGRLNLAGLNMRNVAYVARGIRAAVTHA